MSEHITHPPTPPPEPALEAIPEWAPSEMTVDEPTLPRWIGGVGLVLLTLGCSTLAATYFGRTTIIHPFWAALFFLFGVICLLYHAATDADLQLRRTYISFGCVWLLLGAVLALVPNNDVTGYYFLPYGLLGLILGLLFCLAALRFETDVAWHNGVSTTIAMMGVLMALAGFVFGNYSLDFLLGRGLVFILLGLFFLWAYVALKGSDDPLGYRVGLALGLIGVAALGVALVRSGLAFKGYTMPAGLLLGSCGTLYALIGLGICSDRPLVVMTRRELAGFFYSPIAYIVFISLTMAAWLMFVIFTFGSLWPAQSPQPNPQVEPIISSYIVQLVPVICMIFLVPAVTMKSLSEEQRTGTLEVLLTAPISETSVVLSKFFAAFLFFMLLWLPWGLFLVALRIEGGSAFDYRPLLSFYLALGFMALGFVGSGLFFSSLTKNQLMAAVMTFVAMLVPLGAYLANLYFLRTGSMGEKIVTHTSYIYLLINSVHGKLYLPDLAVHAAAGVLWLFLTVKVLESRKWR